MEDWSQKNFANCPLGDKRLQKRAHCIGQALMDRFGLSLSMAFADSNKLKRAYEFFANTKVMFSALTQPHREGITQDCSTMPVVLAVGDTTYLDYKTIKAKKEGFGPIANGGQGLILHSSIAVEPEQGQPLGILWQKLWHRPNEAKTGDRNIKLSRKQKQAAKRKANKDRPFEQKESYKWVESIEAIEKQFASLKNQLKRLKNQEHKELNPSIATRVVHIFDAEADVAEVFDRVRGKTDTGLLVRAAYDRSISDDTRHLWDYMEAAVIGFEVEIEVAATEEQPARNANLAVRFEPVSLKAPERLDNKEPFQLYAVYATETNPPEGARAVSWMLLTTEPVTSAVQASQILRWYSYRWHIEEYHKILKSGCKVENYRLAAKSMEALLGFLTVIAAELLRITYMQRTEPDAPAQKVLSPVKLAVLKATSSEKLPRVITVAWALKAVARLGGYLEHRRKTPIGIQVLWRGWLELVSLCKGWELARQT